MSRIRPVTARSGPHSTLCTARDLYKSVSLALLFGSNGNSYRVSTQSNMCTVESRFTTGLRSRIFGCKSICHKTSAI